MRKGSGSARPVYSLVLERGILFCLFVSFDVANIVVEILCGCQVPTWPLDAEGLSAGKLLGGI